MTFLSELLKLCFDLTPNKCNCQHLWPKVLLKLVKAAFLELLMFSLSYASHSVKTFFFDWFPLTFKRSVG